MLISNIFKKKHKYHNLCPKCWVWSLVAWKDNCPYCGMKRQVMMSKTYTVSTYCTGASLANKNSKNGLSFIGTIRYSKYLAIKLREAENTIEKIRKQQSINRDFAAGIIKWLIDKSTKCGA